MTTKWQMEFWAKQIRHTGEAFCLIPWKSLFPASLGPTRRVPASAGAASSWVARASAAASFHGGPARSPRLPSGAVSTEGREECQCDVSRIIAICHSNNIYLNLEENSRCSFGTSHSRCRNVCSLFTVLSFVKALLGARIGISWKMGIREIERCESWDT